MTDAPPLLRAAGVHAHYGASHVLHGVDLTMGDGESVALLGRNGMGKTTTVRAILGLTPPSAGTVEFAGERVAGLRPHRIARRGLALVPEGRRIFANLDVRENLVMAARGGRGGGAGWTLKRVLELFPRLAERLGNMGNQLSGGEQQMLAIGRALMTNPRLLILDEATEGLAPLLRREIWQVVRHIKAAGVATLIIDKDLATLLALCDRAVILVKGHVVWSGAAADLAADQATHIRYLGV